LHAMDELDDELPDRDDQVADLLVARCEALLAAGDVASAAGTVAQLQQATVNSARLSAWATCFDGQLSILAHPERLDDVEAGLEAAAHKLAEIDDAAGEAKAHTVRAQCLARLGRIGDCEIALDDALTAARRARDHRRVNAVLAGAPLAALWGPNPVPRAGGRCLDVVRLLRITTDSPAVEAMSTRCQAVLEAFRGRAAAARRMIDSARRTVVELGLRHAFLEVEQFAGIVELVLDDPVAAEPHLRQAYNGFRRMGLDADTAETAALLGRACLALDRDAEADELCTESERLAGHVLKASIAWRTVRAQLLSRRGDHDEARSVAQAAIALAERTDGLVDHGDACLSMATVLDAAGDAVGARAAAGRAAELYELKGAAALAERARRSFAAELASRPTAAAERPGVDPDTACVRAINRLWNAYDREAWGEVEDEFATEIAAEYRRKIVGFSPRILLPGDWVHQIRHIRAFGGVRRRHAVVAVRGERLALIRFQIGPADTSPGAPQEQILHLYGLDVEGRIALHVGFDGDDVDAAMAELDAVHARFEDERSQTRRLENTATRVFERVWSRFAVGDWDAVGEAVSDSYSGMDHRRVVNSENQHGRDAVVKDLKAAADVGFTISMVGVTAIRGERLALARVRAAGRDPEAISNEALNVVEIDADARIARVATFDLEDFDAAIAELESRYLAGEAAAHASTWSVVAAAYDGFNRRELLATTPDWVNVDHRRGAGFASGDMNAYIEAAWDDSPDTKIYIGAVHRLSDIGAVVSHVARGISQEGFDGEWRDVNLLAIEGDMVGRSELFNEADLDAAIARFDQLGRPSPGLENTASRVHGRLRAYFAARDWDAMAAMLTDDASMDDRRRIVGSEVRRGRDATMAEWRTLAEIGVTTTTSVVIATRGTRLAMCRTRASTSGAFDANVLQIVDIDADERVVAVVTFDLDDFDAAIAELDARYLAGEAAGHARTWSALAQAFAAVNRHELPKLMPDWVNIDHRRGATFASGDMTAYIHDLWNDSPDINMYIEVVHRLNSLGAVITQAAHGTSQQGFEAEWRESSIFMFDGDLVSRCELFDKEDLGAALARFDQLSRPAPRLENRASRTNARYVACFNAREWDTMASILAENFYSDDRRRITGTGTRRGRDAEIENLRVAADLGATVSAEVIATRGDRLVVTRTRVSMNEQQQGFLAEALLLVETDLDGRVAATNMLDPEDFEATFE
ncbi:MAG: hypothetical protein QOE12_1458, partial [Mycobacterium sp.]|nr:hypothetical protein [Mycobacterium sp.]